MALVVAGPAAAQTGSPFLDLAIDVPLGAAIYAASLALIWLASGRPDGAESEIAYLLAKLRRGRRAAA
jgi:hypothetical protein